MISVGDRVRVDGMGEGVIVKVVRDTIGPGVFGYVIILYEMAPMEYAYNTHEVLICVHDVEKIEGKNEA